MQGPASDWLSEIFQPEPVRWGLRGDPHLWRALQEALRDQARPGSEAALEVLLKATLVRVLGDSPVSGETAYVERFASGGMSSGQVSLGFWRDTALPLLCRRFSESSR